MAPSGLCRVAGRSAWPVWGATPVILRARRRNRDGAGLVASAARWSCGSETRQFIGRKGRRHTSSRLQLRRWLALLGFQPFRENVHSRHPWDAEVRSPPAHWEWLSGPVGSADVPPKSRPEGLAARGVPRPEVAPPRRRRSGYERGANRFGIALCGAGLTGPSPPVRVVVSKCEYVDFAIGLGWARRPYLIRLGQSRRWPQQANPDGGDDVQLGDAG